MASDWQRFDFSRLESGPLYFYLGAGLSMDAGLVSWSEMACLIWWYLKHYEKKKDLSLCPTDDAEENAAFLQEFIAEKETRESSVRIMSRESKDPRALGRTALLNVMLRRRAPRIQLVPGHGEAVLARPPAMLRDRPGRELDTEDLVLHSLVWRTGCHGVLTSNYDMLLEHAFSLYNHGADLHSYRYTADFLRYLLSNRRFVLKLHGDINDLRTMEFDPKGAWEEEGSLGGEEARGRDLEKIYSAALRRGHMIYVGCGFRDQTIQNLHDAWTPEGELLRHCRVALIPGKELEQVADRFRGIEFVTCEDPSFEVRQFLERVVAVRSEVDEPWRPCLEASDIYRQIFLFPTDDPPVQNVATELWTCRGIKLEGDP